MAWGLQGGGEAEAPLPPRGGRTVAEAAVCELHEKERRSCQSPPASPCTPLKCHFANLPHPHCNNPNSKLGPASHQLGSRRLVS